MKQKYFITLLTMICAPIVFAQSDSMFVKMKGGTIRGYPVSEIDKIFFKKTPTSVKDIQMMQKVLSSFALSQNYPNPFNPSTKIEYSIPDVGEVKITIYDVQGRTIKTIDKSTQSAGNYSFVWDSRNDQGTSVASGTYFCQIAFNNYSLIKKLLLIK